MTTCLVTQGVESMGPMMTKTHAQAGELLQTLRSKLEEWWKLAQNYLQDLYKKAGPTLQKTLRKLQVGGCSSVICSPLEAYK